MSVMNNIENTYVRYDDLVEVVGDKVIKSRIKQINQKMIDFLDINNLNEVAYINNMALTHAIIDYFWDIHRLKIYQKMNI